MTISPAPMAVRFHRMPIFVGLGLVGLVVVILAGVLAIGRIGGAHGPFSPTGSMITGRYGATATALPDGRVLIAGGYNFGSDSEILASAELYDPKAGTFSPTGSMTTGRAGHTATLLSDGRILVAGGRAAGSGIYNSLTSAELYDPATGSFSPTGSMSVARFQHTATLLKDGRVLVAGGLETNGVAVDSATLYDPKTDSFSPTGSMSIGREEHTATLLTDGRVLVAGGSDGSKSLVSAELYEPATDSFSPTGSMAIGREEHTATLLTDGRVLVAGGSSNAPGALASAELYDPKTGSFSPTGSMSIGRYWHTATLLTDGRVLVAGGNDGSKSLASAELYDPATGGFVAAGSMATDRFSQTATLLSDGRVLIAGGGNTPGPNAVSMTASAELFQP